MYKCKHEPVFLNSHRDESRVGKKVFKEQLYQTTSLVYDPDKRNRNTSHSYSLSRSLSKRRGYEQPTGGGRPDEFKGKRRALHEKDTNQMNWNMIGFDPYKRVDTSPVRFCKRRHDQSPSNQNRLSPGFNIFKANQGWVNSVAQCNIMISVSNYICMEFYLICELL